MSADERDNLDPQRRLAQDAVRGLGAAPVDPAFRARLKAQFAAGAIPDDTPQATPRSRAEVAGWGLLAAAALALAVLTGFNALPGPRLLAAHGQGEVVVDGTTVMVADAAALDRLLRPGSRLETGPEAVIDLEYPGSLTMRVEASTQLVLPARPGRWHHRAVTADLTIGEVSVRTGPRLAGGRLDVATPVGSALISGTLINVFHNGTLTCFCLHDGTAHVHTAGPDTHDLGAVPAMMRRVTFADGRDPLFADITPAHLEHLLEFDQALTARGATR